MAFWPGKGLFVNRNKRTVSKIRVLWYSSLNYINGASQLDNSPTNHASPVSEITGDVGSPNVSDNLDASSTINDQGKKFSVHVNGGRTRKKRRTGKSVSDHLTNSKTRERLNDKHENGGKGKLEANGDKDASDTSNDNVIIDGSKSRETSSDHAMDESTNLFVTENTLNTKDKKRNGGTDDKSRRLSDDVEDDDWDGVRDSIGPMTLCSSSSSLSSSCSNHSLIKHYTNVMMNCCDNHFKEDCDNVRNKIERILKAHWRDRLNRVKDKSTALDGNSNGQPNSQPPKQSSQVNSAFAFELRPARLPLNKKTWSKLRRSNQNSDWLLNGEN